MKVPLGMKIVALTVFSLAFLISAFLIVTSWSLVTVVVVAVVVTLTGVGPFAFGLNEALERKWPWIKSKWFVIVQRTLAVCAILIGLYVLLS
jgi:hypothetical protein